MVFKMSNVQSPRLPNGATKDGGQAMSNVLRFSLRLLFLTGLCFLSINSFGQPEQAEPSAEKEPGIIEQEMVLIKAGTFLRGTKETGKTSKINEMPQYPVRLNSFYIDKYEVTNAMYKKFVDAVGHPAPQHWTDGEIPMGKENHPVVYVSWKDASAYAEWAGKRLPTGAEWERAARGADGRNYPWGNEFDKLKCRSAESNIRDTAEVNEYENGKSPDGCYNMAGNVWEWVQDRYDWRYYKRYICPDHGLQSKPGKCGIESCNEMVTQPDNNPTGPADDEKIYSCPEHGVQVEPGEQGNCPVEGCGKELEEKEKFPERVIRGGSWSDKTEDTRCAKRTFYSPDQTSFKIGFRCAKDAK